MESLNNVNTANNSLWDSSGIVVLFYTTMEKLPIIDAFVDAPTVPLPKPPPAESKAGDGDGSGDGGGFTLSSTMGKALTDLDLGKTPTNS